MDDARDARSEWFPNRIARRWSVLYFLFALLSAGVLLMGTAGGWLATAALAGGTAMFTTLGVRGVRSGVELRPDGLTSHTDAFTRRLAWQDVERFENRLFRGLGAWLHDGRWVALQSCPERTVEGERLLDRLRSAHGAARRGEFEDAREGGRSAARGPADGKR